MRRPEGGREPDALLADLTDAGDDVSPGARISMRDVWRGNEKIGVPVAGSMKPLTGV